MNQLEISKVHLFSIVHYLGPLGPKKNKLPINRKWELVRSTLKNFIKDYKQK